MAKFRLYKYKIKSEKYLVEDVQEITLRSSWEVDFAEHCDLLPSVLAWGYEMIQIPYRDPLTGKQKIYIPDFFVRILGSDGVPRDNLFEIKPMHEQLDNHARNSKDAALIARNKAKWLAAVKWADRHHAEFSVLNEKDLYDVEKKGRKYPVKQYAHTSTKPKKVSRGPKRITKTTQSHTRKPRRKPISKTRASSVSRTSSSRKV